VSRRVSCPPRGTADILHRIGATAAPEVVYAALTTPDGLAAWWTTDTTGDGVVGGTIQFRFGEAGEFDMKVLDQRPNERVEWEVTDGPAEWIGARVGDRNPRIRSDNRSRTVTNHAEPSAPKRRCRQPVTPYCCYPAWITTVRRHRLLRTSANEAARSRLHRYGMVDAYVQ
jgi:hypothetical protein